MQFFSDIAELFGEYNIVAAFGLTVLLAIASAIGSMIIGTVVAILRVCPVSALRLFGAGYVNTIRNTPLTLIVFFCVFGLALSLNWQLVPGGNFVYNNIAWGIVGLSVYHAAFVAEAIRSGVNTVPLGQAEAARAIGLTFGGTVREVVLPQAFRGAIAPLANTLIALTKNTTVVATVGVAEAAATMRAMIEFSPDLLVLIFLVISFGFVVLTLPTGIVLTRLSEKLAVAR